MERIVKIEAASVDEYLAALPTERAAALTQVRKVIRAAAPKAREMIQYGVPYYELNGMVASFASQKNYMCLYFCDSNAVQELFGNAPGLDLGKDRVRFTRVDDLPMDAVRTALDRMLALRAAHAPAPPSRTVRRKAAS
jgi:uncharacterized protein YdhG (YjbR/CyaY superfamily)